MNHPTKSITHIGSYVPSLSFSFAQKGEKRFEPMLTKMITTLTVSSLLILTVGFVQAAYAQTCQPAPVGLVSWWAADGNALDARSRNNGTPQNGATFSLGKTGQSFSLDGSNDYIRIPHSSTLNLTNFTLETWLKTNQPARKLGIIWSKNSKFLGYNDPLLLSIGADGKAIGRVGKGDNATEIQCASTVAVTDDRWHHLALTFDGSDLRLYLDGNLNDSQPVPFPLFTNFQDLIVGQWAAHVPNPLHNYRGIIDELSLYNRALSDSEIGAIFRAGQAGKCKPTATVAPSGQVAWFAGDGDANDIAGTNNGALQNGASFAIGKVGQGFSFDGTDDFIEAALPQSFPKVTVEAWVKPFSAVNDSINQELIFGQVGTAQIVVRPGTGGGNKAVFQFRDSSDGFQKAISVSDIPLNDWSHIAGTYDGVTLRLYINGVLNAESTPTNITMSSCLGPLFIGGFRAGTFCSFSNPPSQFFNGIIDEASIYNRDLSQTEITSIFNAGIAGKLKETITTGTTARVGDVTVTYASLATRRTHQIPFEPANVPVLPQDFGTVGLFYDIATDSIPTATVDVCFNLPSFNNPSQFARLRVLQLENGGWQNRTTTHMFASHELCGQTPARSALAIGAFFDNDGDDQADRVDPDDDNDGQSDIHETACNSNTLDPKSKADDTDNDNIPDCVDNCRIDQNSDQMDGDGDRIGDVCDADADGDGVNKPEDSDDLNRHVCRDADTDTCDDCSKGRGSNPADDGADWPDNDGLCNLGDLDDDNDGVNDPDDSASLNRRVCRDKDEDTCDDCSNGVANPANDGFDRDSDGQCDRRDNCPDDANPDQADHDGDRAGNICDEDDDNDDTPDSDDAFQFNRAEWLDTNLDRVGNNADPDDDGDGLFDAVDNCPWDLTSSQADDDGDFIGNACDPFHNPDIQLVFVHHDGDPEIYVMNANGADVRLTNNTSFDVEPALSPDRKKVAFSSNRDGNFEIYSMNIADRRVTRLTDTPASEGHATWSPDGNMIVFTSNRGSGSDYRIFSMNAADGSDVRRLSSHPGLKPTWSPNGRKIAFIALSAGRVAIFSMNLDGTGLKQLNGGHAWSPTWSPDGSQIAFVSRFGGKAQIHFMNANGDSVTRLTTPFSVSDVAWGANNKIAYTANVYDRKMTYRENVDGTRLVSPHLPPFFPGVSPHW